MEATELSTAIIILCGVNLGPLDRFKSALQTRGELQMGKEERPRKRKALNTRHQTTRASLHGTPLASWNVAELPVAICRIASMSESKAPKLGVL